MFSVQHLFNHTLIVSFQNSFFIISKPLNSFIYTYYCLLLFSQIVCKVISNNLWIFVWLHWYVDVVYLANLFIFNKSNMIFTLFFKIIKCVLIPRSIHVLHWSFTIKWNVFLKCSDVLNPMHNLWMLYFQVFGHLRKSWLIIACSI